MNARGASKKTGIGLRDGSIRSFGQEPRRGKQTRQARN